MLKRWVLASKTPKRMGSERWGQERLTNVEGNPARKRRDARPVVAGRPLHIMSRVWVASLACSPVGKGVTLEPTRRVYAVLKRLPAGLGSPLSTGAAVGLDSARGPAYPDRAPDGRAEGGTNVTTVNDTAVRCGRGQDRPGFLEERRAGPTPQVCILLLRHISGLFCAMMGRSGPESAERVSAGCETADCISMGVASPPPSVRVIA